MKSTMLKRICLTAGLLLAGIAPAEAQLDFSQPITFGGEAKKEEALTKSIASASVESYKKDQSFYIACTVEAKAPWHSYFRNPGTVGLEPLISVTAPEGFKLEGPYWEVPKLGENSNGFYIGYDNLDFVWKVTPQANAPASATFKFDAQVAVCNDEGCSDRLPSSDSITLSEGSAAPNPNWGAKEKGVEKLGGTPLTAQARISEDAKSIILTVESAQPLEGIGFISEDNAIAPYKAIKTTQSEGKIIIELPFNDGSDPLYPYPMLNAPALPEGQDVPSPPASLKGILKWKGGHSSIDTPTSDTAPAATATSSTPAPEATAVPSQAGFLPSGFITVAGSLFLGGLILNLMPCVFPIIGLKIMSFVELAGGERRKILLHSYTFVLGVLVCFWIISMGLIIVSQLGNISHLPWTEWFSAIWSNENRDGLTWGGWLQHAWVIYSLTLIFLILGLSMFGLFEIGVSATGAGQELQNKKGLSGSFFSGLLATVAATPCAAPFLGASMSTALAMPPVWLLVSMSFMAIGFAFPYIVIGAFPSLIKFLPKPGAWMESLKQGLSFLLFGAVVWLADMYFVFIPDSIDDGRLWIMIGLVIICAAFWVYGRWCPIYKSKTSRRVGGLIALALFAGGFMLSMPYKANEAETQIPLNYIEEITALEQATPSTAAPTYEADTAAGIWKKWTPEAMVSELKKGKAVYVDFTAKWCATCIVNKKAAYTDEVLERMAKAGIVLMKADKTKPNAAIDAEIIRLKRSSVPVNALYQKGKKPAITAENLFPGYMMDFVEKHIPAQ